MSKFIVTNNFEGLSKRVRESINNGFEISGHYSNKYVSAVSFFKLGMKDINYLKLNDDFIMVVGTCIYSDEIGESMLHAIYDDYNGNVNDIRDNIIGNCAVIIKKGDEITIFGEYIGFYNIYYYISEKYFCVTHDLFDLCNLFNELEIEKKEWLYRITDSGTWTNKTFIKGVHELTDREMIIINTRTGCINTRELTTSWRDTQNFTYEELTKKVGDTLLNNMRSVVKHYGTPALSSTGGLDNRLNLASCLAIENQPDLYYGIGNSSVTNTKSGDMEVNRMFRDKFNLNLNEISWRTPEIVDSSWDYLASIYGYNSIAYCGSEDFYNSYRNIKNRIILFGYAGETYRSLPFMENNGDRDLTLEEYLNKYVLEFFKFDNKIFPQMNQIKNDLYNRIYEYCKKWNINPNEISPNDIILLDFERRRLTDVLILNTMNYHHYCAYLLGQHNVVKYLTKVNSSLKDKAKFQLDLINYIYPKVLEIPIFSHCSFHKYDIKSNTIKDTKEQVIKKCLKELFPTPIRKAIKYFYLKKDNSDRKLDLNVLEAVEKVFSKSEWEKDVDYQPLKYGELSRQYSQGAQLLYVAEKAGVKTILNNPKRD